MFYKSSLFSSNVPLSCRLRLKQGRERRDALFNKAGRLLFGQSN
jgi:hypothetical protein